MVRTSGKLCTGTDRPGISIALYVWIVLFFVTRLKGTHFDININYNYQNKTNAEIDAKQVIYSLNKSNRPSFSSQGTNSTRKGQNCYHEICFIIQTQQGRFELRVFLSLFNKECYFVLWDVFLCIMNAEIKKVNYVCVCLV